MANQPRTYRLGQVLEHVYYDCLDYWRTQYHRSEPLGDLLGGPIANIETQLVTWPQGKAHVICTVYGRRKSETEAYFFKIQRIGPAEWVVQGGSFEL